MSAQTSPGPRIVNGFPVVEIYDMSKDVWRIEYMGEHFICGGTEKTDAVVNAFCNCVFKLNGGKYGVSRQATSQSAEYAEIISIDDKLRREVNLDEVRSRYC